MAHPGDLSALADAFDAGTVRPASICAVIGKTEGNGGVNDFTRGYFTQSLMALLSARLDEPQPSLAARIPCVLSGGTEGVLSPHYIVLCREPVADDETDVVNVVNVANVVNVVNAGNVSDLARFAGVAPTADVRADTPSLAVGTAFSPPCPAHDIGRAAHVNSVAEAVRAAMADAGIDDPADVVFVQVKCPCVTAARAQASLAHGFAPASTDPNRSMALARAAGAFGVAVALGEMVAQGVTDDDLLKDFTRYSGRASISSGVEVIANEVIVLGNSQRWRSRQRIACAPMRDALDIGAVGAALAGVGIEAAPQVLPAQRARIAAVLVKCEPDRRGTVRGHRHTMLDDTDINAQRHIRGAVGGMVAAVIGDGRIFVSGGAEHQGPDGGGLIAVIAAIGLPPAAPSPFSASLDAIADPTRSLP